MTRGSITFLPRNSQRCRCVFLSARRNIIESLRTRNLGSCPQVLKISANDARECAGVDWLGDIAVAAGLSGVILISLHRVGGERDDNHVFQRGVLPQAASQLQTIHARKLNIYEDKPRT